MVVFSRLLKKYLILLLTVLLFAVTLLATSPELILTPQDGAVSALEEYLPPPLAETPSAEVANTGLEQPPDTALSFFAEVEEQKKGDFLQPLARGINRAIGATAMRQGKIRLAEVLKSPGSLAPGQVIRFDTFEKGYNIILNKVDSESLTASLSGRVENFDLGAFHLSTTGGETMGILRLPEENKGYFLNYDQASGEHLLFEVALDDIDQVEGLPALLPTGFDAEKVSLHGLGDEKQFYGESGVHEDDFVTEREMLENPASPAVIDVMVAYTPAAKNWAGGTAGIHNVISQAMLLAQEALTNSNTGTTMRLVHTAEVSYTESGNGGTDLNRLTGTTDGYMDIVHTWRNQHGADLVALFASVNYGGIAWLYQGLSNEAMYGFSVTRVQQAAWTYTHIHEMGHNMGAHHHKQQNFQPGPNSAIGGYAAAWRFQANSTWYNTLMAYSEGIYYPPGSPGAGITSIEIGCFSSPLVNFYGVPTGHSVDGDNARVLRETKHNIAAYRNAQVATYNLTVNSSNPASGVEIISSTGHGGTTGYSRSINSNSSVNLEAPVYLGSGESRKRFNHWTGALNTTDRSITLTMDGNKTLTANYIDDQEAFIALGDAVDAPELTWVTGGHVGWFGQSATTHDGLDAAQSGLITHNQDSWMETTVTGPGTLSFWWKVSSETFFDHLEFYINGTPQERISGEVNWQQKNYTLSTGSNSLRWRYVKDFSAHRGTDSGWVDQVVWDPAELTGSIQVFIEPQEAIDAGAQWRLTIDPDEEWRDSGDIATGLAPGTYTITFKEINGLSSPADIGLNLEEGENVTVD